MASVFNPDGTLTLPHNFVQQAAGADQKIYADDVDENFDTLSTASSELKKGFAVTSLGPVAEKSQSLGTISGTVTIDLSAGLSVSATIGGATTLAFTGVPTGGAIVVVLRLTNGGSAAVTWPTTISWVNSKAPTLTSAGTDMVVLVTDDGGATWWGSAGLKYGAGA